MKGDKYSQTLPPRFLIFGLKLQRVSNYAQRLGAVLVSHDVRRSWHHWRMRIPQPVLPPLAHTILTSHISH